MRAADQKSTRETAYTLPLEEISKADLPKVGGKNASLGEMIANLTAAGIQVPRGFAITVDAYREFLRHNGLEDRIRRLLMQASGGDSALAEAGQKLRKLICAAEIPPGLCEDIAGSYEAICRTAGLDDLPVAVRASATSDDLTAARFAGRRLP